MSISYRKVTRAVSSIDLDLTNPRLAGIVKRQAITTQKDAVVALTNSSDVHSLCHSIVSNGFHPDEVLIAVEDETGKKNRVTVIEGNRRLSACKILLQPNLLKGTPDFNKINRLTKNSNYKEAIESIKRLSVVILTSRSEAAAYLASKHTSDSIKRWSPYTQGAYLYGFLREYKTVENVKKILRGSMLKAKIKEKLMHYQLTEEILNLECWNEQELDFLLSGIDKLNIGAIIRFISSSEFMNNICEVKISESGKLSVTTRPSSKVLVDSSIFCKILEKLSRDALITERLNTRQEDKKAMSDYLKEFIEEFRSINGSEDTSSSSFTFTTYEDTPDNESHHDDTTTEDNESGRNNSENDQSTHSGTEKHQHTRKKVEKLLPQSLTIPHANTKLLSLCTEAQKLPYKTNLYSSSLMIRAILEVTLKLLLKRTNNYGDLKKQYKDRSSDFANILNFVEKNTSKIVDYEDIKVVRNAVSDLQQQSKELLNLTNHEDTQLLTEKEVEHVRAKMLELITSAFKKL
ncbi:hypothetical protein [Vibrio sp. H11]|uniref:hypothetical protein n=1 Tax=Vibrio sp. H11 TaxID=2565928 RepID=UPI0010A64102|nr:hypothetical protein [Vibrio sp. H11]